MDKKNEETIESHLKEMQAILVKPGERVVGTVGHLFNFLNPLGKDNRNHDSEEKKSSIKEQKYNNIVWVDIENPKRSIINQIARDYPFHPLHLEASLLTGQLDRIEREEEYLLILLHNPSYNAQENKISTDQVCIFLSTNYLVTIHDESAKIISNLFKECEEDKERQEALFKKSPSFLLYNIIDALAKDMFIQLQNTLKELDEIEDLVFDVKVSGVYKISHLRQKIVRLRKIIGSFKNIVSSLAADQKDFIGSMSRYYKNLANEVNKLWETLEEARETIEIYKDADFTVSTEKTNRTLAVLTVIFTLTIPTTVFGSFYGMNILLPGGIEYGSWTILGPFTALYFIIALSILSIIIMLGYFKYKDWW